MENAAQISRAAPENAAEKLKYLQQQPQLVDIRDQGIDNDKAFLMKWLSLSSVTSIASSECIEQEEAKLDTYQGFRCIGLGFCAEIFAQIGSDENTVLKRARPQKELELWADITAHLSVRECVMAVMDRDPSLDLSIPKVHGPGFITKLNPWWIRNYAKWPKFREATSILMSERIHPLPSKIRQMLISQYCPKEQQAAAIVNPDNRDCLMRLYLGRRLPTTILKSNEFSLRNFEADLAIIDDLNLEKYQYARAMAAALASIHWDSLIDGADIEFILGSSSKSPDLTSSDVYNLHEPTDMQQTFDSKKNKTVNIWLLDFNQCKKISKDENGVKKAVEAFWQNDPYYPRYKLSGHQDHKLWQVFEQEYLANCGEVNIELGVKFIDAVKWESLRRSVLTSGPPPSWKDVHDGNKMVLRGGNGRCGRNGGNGGSGGYRYIYGL